jgi:hypothetical protein
MKLFTKSIDKKLFAQYDKGSDLKNQKVIAKIFNPYGRGTWYILNSDPEDPDYLWAITDLFEIEIGSVSRNELENIKVPPFRLPLERDMYFDEINAYELYQGLKEGKRYADGGETTKVDEFGSMSFRGVYDDYEMIVISKESEKDGGEIHTDRFLVSAKDINEAKKITEDLWRKNFNDSDLSIVKIMSEEAYRFKKINGLDIYYNGGYMADGGQLRSYKTFVEEYPDKKIYVRVKFAGADKDVQNYTANEENKKRAISFAKRLAEKNNGTYEGFKIYTYAKGGYMAKGGFLKDAKYVSKRNISSITLELDGKSVTLKGEDLVDGVYVKKTQSATKSATKTKVDAREVANKLSDLYYDVWDKLKIESGSQIYSSDATQKKLNKELKAIGIDEIYSKLTKPERRKVSDILTDENQHSLRNYLGLRGYNGEQEYNSYKNMYEDNIKDYKRAFTLNPKNFDRVLAEGGGLGDSTYLVKVAEEYAEKEYGKKVKKGAGVAKAKKVGDKYDYSQVTVFFQDGTQETFEREDFEEFFEIED